MNSTSTYDFSDTTTATLEYRLATYIPAEMARTRHARRLANLRRLEKAIRSELATRKENGQ